MVWWSIGFTMGVVLTLICIGIGAYLDERLERHDNHNPDIRNEPYRNDRGLARPIQRYSPEEVKLVLYELIRSSCRYEREVLTQLINDIDREETE